MIKIYKVTWQLEYGKQGTEDQSFKVGAVSAMDAIEKSRKRISSTEVMVADGHGRTKRFKLSTAVAMEVEILAETDD